MSNTDDEITRFVNARYVSPCEAAWRLLEFPVHGQWPPVQHLAVHLEGQQTVYFTDNLSLTALAEKTTNARSTLIGFFQYNTDYPDGRQYLYHEFPSYYT